MYLLKLMNILHSILKVIREEIIVVIFFLLFMSTIQYSFLLVFGWMGAVYDPPSIDESVFALRNARKAPDSDGDGLPDIIELAPKGKRVYYKDVQLGVGTGTNPFRMDSDGDLFTDAAEDKAGTDPNNFFDLGWFWIIWGIFLSIVIYLKYIYKPNRLKVYQQNEILISSGSGKKGKFAYAASEEEIAARMKADPRFQELTEVYQDPQMPRHMNNKAFRYLVLGGLFLIVTSISYTIYS